MSKKHDEHGLNCTERMSTPRQLVGQVEAYQWGIEDWTQYVERLDQYFEANEITDEGKKRATFLTVVGGKTYSLLSNLLAPEKPSSQSYADLVRAVKEHIDPAPLVIAERFRFSSTGTGRS